MHAIVNTFEPADFNNFELRFLREHLKESPTVAMHGGLPKHVSPEAVTGLLGRLRELDELNKARNLQWSGYEPIEESIDRWLAYQATCLEAQANGEPRHPSQAIWDSTGAKIDQGIGSDAAEKVRHELLPDGTRRPFAVALVASNRRAKVWGRQAKPADTSNDKITHEHGIVACTICDKPITSYDVSTASTRIKNKAIKLGRDHCMTSKFEEARHRAIANVPVA